MRSEIIAIGDEMTSGQRLDTNSQWLSQRLGDLGIPVAFHTTVADRMTDIVSVFHAALARAEIIVITGGLGPTADDLTRDALAAATGRALELNEQALAHIEQLFARRQRDMPQRNRLQAMFPAGSEEIFNPGGTAPGIFLTAAREEIDASAGLVHLFALPGVPAEMKTMWHDSVVGKLNELGAASRVIRHRVIKCFGVGESRMEELLPELIARDREPLVGITVHAATISLRITASGADEAAALAAMEPTTAEIYGAVGALAFGEGDDELEHAVVRLLAARKQTLATAESGTCGRIAQWLSEVPDSEEVFQGGMVAAATGRFTSDDDARRQVAEGGARSVRQQFGADYGLAVSPLPLSAGDDSGELFYYSLATPDEVITRSSTTAGHPAILKDRAAKQALNLLRLTLSGSEDVANF
ncbi:MAG: CinA family nicotinamide mononucleotide deamidase-related protein [Pirellulales bacterium]